MLLVWCVVWRSGVLFGWFGVLVDGLVLCVVVVWCSFGVGVFCLGFCWVGLCWVCLVWGVLTELFVVGCLIVLRLEIG